MGRRISEAGGFLILIPFNCTIVGMTKSLLFGRSYFRAFFSVSTYIIQIIVSFLFIHLVNTDYSSTMSNVLDISTWISESESLFLLLIGMDLAVNYKKKFT